MGKNIIVYSFLFSLGFSLFIFFSREDRRIRDQINQGDKREPLITVEDFTAYKYIDHKVISTLSGKLGQFIEPNILELYGQIRGMRHDVDEKQYIFSESAVAYYRSQGLAQLAKDSSLRKAEIENSVRIGTGSKVLMTEYAEYIEAENRLKSDWEVLIKTPNSQINGKQGFDYDVLSKDLTVMGPINGVLNTNRK